MKQQKKKSSIRFKLLVTIIPLIAVVIIVILTVNFVNTKKTMTKSIYGEMEEESNYNTEVIARWESSIIASLNSVKDTLETVKFESDEDELNYLATTTKLNAAFPNGVYEGDADARYLDGSGWKPGADFVVTQRDWYKEGLDHSGFTFGEPYMDANTGTFTVSASAVLNRRDRNKMVAAADISLQDVTNQVTSINVMDAETGYAFLVDTATGMILAHPDTSYNASKISAQGADSFLGQISTRLGADKFNIYTIKDGTAPYFVTVQAVDGTTWKLVMCVSQNEMFESLRKTEGLYILIGVIAILFAIAVVSRVVSIIIAPLKGLTEGIARLTDGDFTVQIEAKGNDEIGRISHALGVYVDSMRAVIKDVQNISLQLDEKAGVSTTTSESLSQTAESQSQSMEDMRTTIEQLANAVSELAENATTLATVVDTADKHGAQANEKMRGTVDTANRGYEDMDAVQKNMKHIVDSMQQLAEVVENVGVSTKEINEIIKMIGDIAAQTNLLSLNASIEAARAGEAGRGFAVVAGEIGTLADNSAHSVQQIGEIIANINGQVDTMVERTRESVTTIQENTLAVNKAYETFHTIYTDINSTSEIVTSMIEEIEQVNDVASNMAAISEEQSASAEEISATIEVLAANAQTVTQESTQVEECAEVVAESAETLTGHMQKFKL